MLSILIKHLIYMESARRGTTSFEEFAMVYTYKWEISVGGLLGSNTVIMHWQWTNIKIVNVLLGWKSGGTGAFLPLHYYGSYAFQLCPLGGVRGVKLIIWRLVNSEISRMTNGYMPCADSELYANYAIFMFIFLCCNSICPVIGPVH